MNVDDILTMGAYVDQMGLSNAMCMFIDIQQDINLITSFYNEDNPNTEVVEKLICRDNLARISSFI